MRDDRVCWRSGTQRTSTTNQKRYARLRERQCHNALISWRLLTSSPEEFVSTSMKVKYVRIDHTKHEFEVLVAFECLLKPTKLRHCFSDTTICIEKLVENIQVSAGNLLLSQGPISASTLREFRIPGAST